MPASLFGQRVRELRGSRTQAALAQAAGLTPGRIRQLEHGDLGVPPRTVGRLARALNTEPVALGVLLLLDHASRPPVDTT